MKFVDYLQSLKGTKPQLADKYGEWQGYLVDDYDCDKGLINARLTIKEQHLSPSGAVHGGVVAGFLDFCCGCAVFTKLKKNQLCSTVDLSTKYFKPIKQGNVLLATAELVHLGRSLSSTVSNVYIEGKPDTIVAMATATFNQGHPPKILQKKYNYYYIKIQHLVSKCCYQMNKRKNVNTKD